MRDIEQRIIVNLFRLGLHMQQIADRVGYSKAYVRRYLSQNIEPAEYEARVYAIRSRCRKQRNHSGRLAKANETKRKRRMERWPLAARQQMAMRFIGGEPIVSIARSERLSQRDASEFVRQIVGPDAYMQLVTKQRTAHLKPHQWKKGVQGGTNRNTSCAGSEMCSVSHGSDDTSGHGETPKLQGAHLCFMYDACAVCDGDALDQNRPGMPGKREAQGPQAADALPQLESGDTQAA